MASRYGLDSSEGLASEGAISPQDVTVRTLECLVANYEQEFFSTGRRGGGVRLRRLWWLRRFGRLLMICMRSGWEKLAGATADAEDRVRFVFRTTSLAYFVLESGGGRWFGSLRSFGVRGSRGSWPNAGNVGTAFAAEDF